METEQNDSGMTIAELEALLDTLREQRDMLEDEEPDNPAEEAYLEWEEKCELLEDQIEEILDLLEEAR